MAIREVIVGFDLRKRAFPEALNSSAYRDQYLYRLDIIAPYTVDTAIWPSLLQKTENLWAWHISRSEFELADNAGELYERFGDGLKSGELLVLAITAVLGHGFALPGELPGITGTEAGACPSWEFFGFDVADRFFLSAVSNAGFSEHKLEKSTLRGSWGAMLNQRHLFSDREAAREFKSFADRVTPEHAPFFVFGLWEAKQQ
jgi:hypothetical protein